MWPGPRENENESDATLEPLAHCYGPKNSDDNDPIIARRALQYWRWQHSLLVPELTAANANFLEIFTHVSRGKQNSSLSWVIKLCPSWPSVCPEFGNLFSPTSGYRRLINAFPCWSHWRQCLPFLAQTRFLFRKAEPPRSRPVPGMVVAPCDEVNVAHTHKGIPTFVPRLGVTITF
jgi:hypothetical protein